MPKPREVFVSHSSHDDRDADELVRFLRRHRIKTFYSPHHIRGGRRWQREIGAALQRCDWFLVLLTPSAVKSMWVEREVQYALNVEHYRERIVPLLLCPCDYESLSWALSTIQLVNVTGGIESAYPELCRLWKIRYAP